MKMHYDLYQNQKQLKMRQDINYLGILKCLTLYIQMKLTTYKQSTIKKARKRIKTHNLFIWTKAVIFKI